MKNKFLTLMLIVSSSFLMNCAKSSDSTTAVASTNVCGVTGYVYTSQSCLPQGSCPAGYGQTTSGSCLPAIASTGLTGSTCQAGYVYTSLQQCLPQGSCPAGYGQSGTQCYAAVATTGTTSTCGVGQVGTAKGCLPQNTCPTGYGYQYGLYNGQMGGWCYPQTY